MLSPFKPALPTKHAGDQTQTIGISHKILPDHILLSNQQEAIKYECNYQVNMRVAIPTNVVDVAVRRLDSSIRQARKR